MCTETDDLTNGTKGCPTAGGRSITIAGTDMYDEATRAIPVVSVDGSACLLSSYTTTELVCSLPTGTGTAAVSLYDGGVFSPLFFMITYAVPQIERISSPSCLSLSDLELGGCSNQGLILTLQGTNFGEQGAKVLMGSDPCTEPVLTNFGGISSLVCRVGAGQLDQVAIVLLQDKGFPSEESVTISSRLCQPGQYLNDTTLQCLPCAPGYFTTAANALSECPSCPPGTSSGTSSAFCETCPPGRYTNQYGTALPCPQVEPEPGAPCTRT